MDTYMINDGADRFNDRDDRDDRDAIVARGVSLVAAIELVHQGCRFCDAGENHTDDAGEIGSPRYRSFRLTRRAAGAPSIRGWAIRRTETGDGP
jgi:hypothetical protein